MAKIQISLKDPEIRAVWESALQAKREVGSWPAWKRGVWEPHRILRNFAGRRISDRPIDSSRYHGIRFSQSGWIR